MVCENVSTPQDFFMHALSGLLICMQGMVAFTNVICLWQISPHYHDQYVEIVMINAISRVLKNLSLYHHYPPPAMFVLC